ncbi:aldehyde dehydrogenase family protein [Prescottella agglutinans]|uniref:Aldehyde dehydrogenase n=1 Tax=Prescottella agglutinans TaxID=1644129 RepID=A0ABT6MDP6_9NOCA|nr:aldehyde dehydrogenase family protein [Prescottella agglutinans]MDH6282428.1 aldehyde dehydrogenase (NAD+) [Prescottella agglutinans]
MTNEMTTNPETTAADTHVAEVVKSLRRVHATGRTRSARWRIEQLRGIERMMIERENEIVRALAADLDRDPVESLLTDISTVRNEAAYARKRVRWWMRRRPQPMPLNRMPAVGWVQYEPLGVVLVIGAWNYPVALTLNPLVAAVAAGNCAVVKPSEIAPESSRLLARLLPEYVDSDAVAVTEGDASVTQELLDQGFDHVFFTGGTEIGRKVMAGAAQHLSPVTLELGGKCPAIVTSDADLDVAARRIVWTKLINSGQTCLAPDYVLVDRAVRDGLVSRLVHTITEFRSDAPSLGMRIVDERHFARLTEYLARTGGTVVFGGGADRATLTMEPTVLVDPDPDDSVLHEEIFGPILPVLEVDSLDEAIDFVHARPKPLAAYFFTRSHAVRRRLLSDISSGGAVVNHAAVHYAVPGLPFGGVGRSGIGSYNGKWGFETFSHRKGVLVQPFKPDPSLVYPPYTDRKIKILRRIV